MYQFTEELRERIVLFLKFSKERWTLELLQKGNLYLNTVEHFRKVEEETKKKGMGDNNEVRLILSEINIKMYDNSTGDLILSGLSKQGAITMQEDSEKHLLCMVYVDFDNLEIIEEGTDYIKALLVFTEEQKRELLENFGEYVLVLSSNDFSNNIRENFETQGIDWKSNKVKYSDFSINYIDRIESFMGYNSDKYFWKDIFFQNQREYRIAVLNKDSNEPFKPKINPMTNYSFITTAEELFNNKFYITVHFNPKKHLITL